MTLRRISVTSLDQLGRHRDHLRHVSVARGMSVGSRQPSAITSWR